jgi:hypothetical protein
LKSGPPNGKLFHDGLFILECRKPATTTLDGSNDMRPNLFLYSTVLSVVLFFTNCNNPVSSTTNWTFKIAKNGSWWEGSSDAQIRNDSTLVVWGIKNKQNGEIDEDIYVETKYAGKGNYAILNAAWRKWQSNDILFASETLSMSANSNLNISEYDSSSGKMVGTCSFTTNSSTGRSVFTNGTFEAIVRRQ